MVRVVRDVDGPDVEELLEIGRPRVVVRGGQRFVADRLIAAVRPGGGMARRELLGNRQRKELVRAPAQLVDETLRHAMTGDREEADLSAGGVDGRRHAAPVGAASSARRLDVDDGDCPHHRVGRAAVHPSCMTSITRRMISGSE